MCFRQNTCCLAALASNSAQERRTTLTLYKSLAQFPAGTSKKRTSGDSQRARRRDIAQGTNVPHVELAEVTISLAGTKV
jgi:hypothetical protein